MTSEASTPGDGNGEQEVSPSVQTPGSTSEPFGELHSARLWGESWETSRFRFAPGDSIGCYRINGQIGEGGFGFVYLAEQTAPVKRQVALKVIKPGMDSAAVVARFEQERQALAVMDHPHVATVYDGGTTDHGLPYFVMEYVNGKPITTFCDEQRLSIDDRIRLFISVCEAVQHAHMKGLIHRDLKPGNILVKNGSASPIAKDGDWGPLPHQPKVIDFGVAKALSDQLGEYSMHTLAGQLIGTPEYMSPEQAGTELSGVGSRFDVDTRSDIYSLGVVLYELLTGSLPIDAARLRAAGHAGIPRIISETNPAKPSTKLLSRTKDDAWHHASGDPGSYPAPSASHHCKAAPSLNDVAARRRTDSKTLLRRLRGDLDWVVMKCLEKDRSRRYSTANALAAELRGYLKNEPVSAGPPSASYRLQKFVQRNRTGVIVGSGVAAALLLASMVAIWFGLSEAEQRRLAEERLERATLAEQLAEQEAIESQRQRKIAESVNEFLTEDILSAVSPERLGRDVLMRVVFDTAAGQLDRPDHRFAGSPEIEAAIRNTLGDTYSHLGEHEAALSHFQQQAALLESLYGRDSAQALKAIGSVGMVHRAMGRYDLAEEYAVESLRGLRRILGDDHPDTLMAISRMATLLRAQGRVNEAIPLYDEALERHRRVLGNDHPQTLTAISNRGAVHRAQGNLVEAARHYQETLDGFRRIHGDDHPLTLTAINNMAVLLGSQGKLDEAGPHYREALAGRRRVLGNDHIQTLTSMNNMAQLLQAQGRMDEAEELFHEALDGLSRTMSDDHPLTLTAMNNLGHFYQADGKLNEAEHWLRAALTGRRRVLGDAHLDTIRSVHAMGLVLWRQNRFADAAPLYREVVELRRVLPDDERGRNRIELINAMRLLGTVLRDCGELADSEQVLHEALIMAKAIGSLHRRVGDVLVALGETLIAQDRLDDARSAFQEAVEVFSSALSTEDSATIAASERLASIR